MHTITYTYTYVCLYIYILYILPNVALMIISMFILASLLSISFQLSGFYQNTVGYRQDVICSISVPPNVDPDTIELGWLNEDDIITDNSRVTIDTSSVYYNDSSIATIIQFDPLFEDDEEEYICYAVINGSFIFEPINLQNFTSKQTCAHMHTSVEQATVCYQPLILNVTFNIFQTKSKT